MKFFDIFSPSNELKDTEPAIDNLSSTNILFLMVVVCTVSPKKVLPDTLSEPFILTAPVPFPSPAVWPITRLLKILAFLLTNKSCITDRSLVWNSGCPSSNFFPMLMFLISILSN